MQTADEYRKQMRMGKKNYLGWSKVITATLAFKKLIIDGELKEGKRDEATNLLLTSMSFEIAGDIPSEEGPISMLAWLKSRFGDDNRRDAETDFKNVLMKGIDPHMFLAALDTALARVKAAGGSVDFDLQLKTMLNGCHQEFYEHFIIQMRKNYQSAVTSAIVENARKELLLHFKSTPLVVREKYASLIPPRANAANWKQRHCTICAEKNPRNSTRMILSIIRRTTNQNLELSN
jgi:hypothetical protein